MMMTKELKHGEKEKDREKKKMTQILAKQKLLLNLN